MNNNYTIVYRTSDNEIETITITGEDHIDAEANFHMLADDNYWTVDEVLSVTTILEYGDEVYEMEDHDNWLDAYVVM